MTDLPERVKKEIEFRAKNWGAPTVARRHMEEVAAIAMECAARPEAMATNCWIPCSERLPANADHVLVAYMPAVRAPEGRVQRRHWLITFCRYSGGAWRFVIPSHKSRLSKRVKFWQPIPDEPSPPMNPGPDKRG